MQFTSVVWMLPGTLARLSLGARSVEGAEVVVAAAAAAAVWVWRGRCFLERQGAGGDVGSRRVCVVRDEGGGG